MRHRILVFWILAVVILAACSTPAATVVPVPPTVTPTAAARPTVVPVSGTTAGQLAELGKVVVSKSCSCHGASGEGRNAPALIGSAAKLDKYGTAQALLEYISRTMPSNARGSLKADEYLHTVGFILVGNKIVSADSPLDAATLGSISLKK